MGGPVPLHLPPLDSLRFFEATARHQSFVLAGKALGVTAAAVGHRIRTLEKHLGAELFERRRRSVHLNRRGRVGARTLSVAIFSKNTVSVGPARYGDGVARRVFRIGEDVSVGLVHSAERKPVFSGSGAKCFDIGNIEDQLGDGLTTFAPSAQGMKHDVAPGAGGIFQLDDAIAFILCELRSQNEVRRIRRRRRGRERRTESDQGRGREEAFGVAWSSHGSSCI